MPRKQERTVVSLDIILEWSSGRRIARMSDISLGGCFIECLTPVPIGTVILFKLKISEEEWVELQGEIVYVYTSLGFGVRFINLTQNKQSILEHIILLSNGNPWGTDEINEK